MKTVDFNSQSFADLGNLLRWRRLCAGSHIPRRKHGERPVEDAPPPPSGG